MLAALSAHYEYLETFRPRHEAENDQELGPRLKAELIALAKPLVDWIRANHIQGASVPMADDTDLNLHIFPIGPTICTVLREWGAITISVDELDGTIPALIADLTDARRERDEALRQDALLDLAVLEVIDTLRESSRLAGEAGEGIAPLRAEVIDGKLSISIGVDTLGFAFERAEANNPFDEGSGDYLQTFKISDRLEFAKDTARAMNDEGEDGSTPLTRFLDSMMMEAVEQGSMGIEDPDLDAAAMAKGE